MKKLKIKTLLLLALLSLIASCNNDEPNLTENTHSSSEKGVPIKLGKKLENPYSIENMQKALGNLKSSKVSAKSSSDNDIKITTTHLYLRFKPKNQEELNILKVDSTLVLYDYPLDYEITEIGDFYKDPEVTGDQPTYQYCAVAVDKKIPEGLEHELLAKLFIPDEYSDQSTDSKRSSKSYSTDMVDALVDEALRITNNLKEANIQGKSSLTARSSKWRPSGTIKVWDDVLNDYVGVEGVQVRARRWFTTHRGFADVNGFYSCDGEFRQDANYSIDWERHDFALQDGWLNGATYNGPKKDGNWDLNLKDDTQEYYATIFRAAHHYYYKDIKDLRRPPQNSFWKTQMKIKAYNESNNEINASHKEERRFLGAQLKIYNPQRQTDEIYGTVIHELAHASHWDMSRSDFDNSESIVKESWARGVQWELTRMVYLNYNSDFENRPKYTLVVRDMIDNDGFYGKTGTFGENVSGYTIKQIENSLRFAKSWDEWKNKIKNDYENSTENNLDALFNYWN